MTQITVFSLLAAMLTLAVAIDRLGENISGLFCVLGR